MVDAEEVVRAYLAGESGLTALTGTRIYSDVDLPPGADIRDGGMLLFSTRGGGQDFSSHVLGPSMQFRSYGATMAAARDLDQALYDALNDAKSGLIKMARLEVPGQGLRDPETRWPFVLSFYRVLVGN